MSNIFTNVKTKLHRDKSSSPNSSSDDSNGTTFTHRSRNGRSSCTSSGTDSDAVEVPTTCLAAKPPQLEALLESPPATVKGSTFAEAFDKAADDIRTKYDSFSIKNHSSFNPSFTQTLPIRRKTRAQRLVSGSKSLFRVKAQHNLKSRDRGSDRRSSATLEPHAPPTRACSSTTSPNWVSVQPAKHVPEEPLKHRSISAEKRRDVSFEEAESPQKRRVISTGTGSHPLQRQGAIYLSATAREEQKLAEDMRRRQAKLENMRNWPLSDELPNTTEPSTGSCPCMDANQPPPGAVPNNAESSTEGCPFLVSDQPPASREDAEELSQHADDGVWEEHSESFCDQLEAMSQARDSLNAEDQIPQETEITSLPFDQASVASLPLVELSPSKVGDPGYQGSPDGSHAQKWNDAVEETIHDIQEPTPTFTYIPLATGNSGESVERNNQQRAQLAAAISSRRPSTDPFISPFDSYFDDDELAVITQTIRSSSSDSSTTTVDSELGAYEDAQL